MDIVLQQAQQPARIVIQSQQQAARDCITKGAATSKDCNTEPAASCKRLYYRAYSKQQDIVIQHPQQLLAKYHIPFVDFAGTLCTIVTGLTAGLCAASNMGMSCETAGRAIGGVVGAVSVQA